MKSLALTFAVLSLAAAASAAEAKREKVAASAEELACAEKQFIYPAECSEKLPAGDRQGCTKCLGDKTKVYRKDYPKGERCRPDGEKGLCKREAREATHKKGKR